MQKRVSLIILFFLFTVSLLTAQSHIIRGTIVDEYGVPFPFVNIFLTTSRTGTVTNSEGAFSLALPGNEDVMNISFMGYETQTFYVNRHTGHLNIQLKPLTYLLDEFVVSSLSAPDLLRQAVERIPYNFLFEPFLTQVYIRSKTFRADTLIYFQEQEYNIVRSYNPSFTDQIFLVRNRYFRLDGGRQMLLRGAGLPSIVKDIHNTFNASFFRRHNIRFLPGTTFDNRSVFVLGISPRNSDEDDDENIRGRIFIDVESLAFVRFEFTPQNGNNITEQYRKIGDKFFLMYGNWIFINRRPGGDIPAKTEFLVTEINLDFSIEDIQGTHVRRDDILSAFVTHEQDTLFWEQHNAILPDSLILQALARYAERQEYAPTRRNRITERLASMDSVQLAAFQRRLYEPNISLVGSTDLLNDFLAINHNLHSLNRYISYRLHHSIRNIWINSLILSTYSYISIPFIDVSSEWLLLNKNGMQTRVGFNNGRDIFYLRGMNDIQMFDFKNDSFLDFMRLHTIRSEGRYVRTFLMEEEIAGIDLHNRNNLLNYRLFYFLELFYNRIGNVTASRRDIRASDRSEYRQPLIIDRRRSWVKYLFRPDEEFQRHVRQDDLTTEEQQFLRRSNRLSWLNLVSPQMFFIPQFQLGDRNRVMLSANYLRTPFGEMFSQNFWLTRDYTQMHGIFIRQYRNYTQTTFGVGYKLYDVPLFRNMYMTSFADFWQQPTDFDFRATTSFSGFRIGQTFEYQLVHNQFSGQNRFSLLLGYDFKTKGYTPHSFFMGQNFNVRAGFKWYLR